MKQPKIKAKKLFVFALGSLCLAFSLLKLLNRYLILPHTNINNIAVGLYSPTQAYKKLQATELERQPIQIRLKTQQKLYQIKSNQLGTHSNILATIAQARTRQQAKNPFKILDVWWKSLINQESFYSSLEVDRGQTLTLLNQLLENENQAGKKPTVSLLVPKQASSLAVELGEPGNVIDINQTIKNLEQAINQATGSEIEVEIVTQSVYTKLNQEEQAAALSRAKAFVGSGLKFTQSKLHLSLEVTDQDIISVLNPKGGIYDDELTALLANWSKEIDQPPQEAVFNYHPETLTVKEFVADQPEISLESSVLKQKIVEFIMEIEQNAKDQGQKPIQKTVELPLVYAQANSALKDSNNLGINQEIGFGESYYYHSIPGRVHNVSQAAAKVQNILIAPGQEFSFNQTLGEVSRSTGFQPAYIIKAGKTELGDGGGVCQVSTTLFRAILNAGLAITKRLPHSYRVSYYELDSKPGIDATVYAGNTDLRFTNDSPNYILIHSEVKPDKFYMNYKIYGTSDGRSSEIVDHLTWGYRPPPPSQYIEDSSLPPGAIKQIDWSASGINAKFTNVIRNKFGEVISQETYTSHYKPWSAKFLVGPNQ